MVWLVDASLTLGNSTSQSVGNKRPAPQGTLGPLFHAELLRATVCLPPTFVQLIRLAPAPGSTTQEGNRGWTTLPYLRTAFPLSKAPEVTDMFAWAIADKLHHKLPRVNLLLPKDAICRAELPAPKPNILSTDLLSLPQTCQAMETHGIWCGLHYPLGQ